MKIFTRLKSWFSNISDDLWDLMLDIASKLAANPKIREIALLEVQAIEAAALAGLKASSLATGTQKFLAAQSAIFARMKAEGIPAANAVVTLAIEDAVKKLKK
jgi:hypothetical protein